ncbi:MAG: DUF3343 domain-containing protein [Clostridium fessum]
MMRQKREYRIFTFHTTAAAMEMEAFCREQGIRGRLVPVPRELSAGCGIAGGWNRRNMNGFREDCGEPN